MFVLCSPGSQIVHRNKITHLNVSHKPPLCQATSFFKIQGPCLIFAALSRKAFLIFSMSLQVPHSLCKCSSPFFFAQNLHPQLWMLHCIVAQAETIITEEISAISDLALIMSSKIVIVKLSTML